jgi:hypothetical protein
MAVARKLAVILHRMWTTDTTFQWISLKETSICVIDEADKIVWRGRVDSAPKAIASAVPQRSLLT